MASSFYHKLIPDYTDLDNDTGSCPPINFQVLENDAGIGISVWKERNSDSDLNVFLNPEEAEELRNSLTEAINRAKNKLGNQPGHPGRVQDPR